MADLAPTREEHKAKKSLGQNFLVDPTVCPRIAEKAGIDGIGVLEIGPGFGALTVELAKRAAKVVAIEIDTDVLEKLGENLRPYPNVKVISGDAMKMDLRSLIEEEFGGMEVAIAGNLPYYITSPLIMKFLEDKLPVTSITAMVQKEPAVRFCAKPGTKDCGAVSAAVWYYSMPKILFDVGPGAFRPRPKVNSAVIRLAVRDKPYVAVKDEKMFFSVVRGAFGQRRKTAANAVSSALSADKETIYRALEYAGADASVRAEKLTMEDFAKISDYLSENM